jgi:hypothetical protein
MTDSPETTDDAEQAAPRDADSPAADGGGSAGTEPGEVVEESVEAERTEAELAALRAEVEDRYDFDEFGPADMAEMEREEWEVAFDPDTWITGTELIDRVEQDLESRIATREVFARLERHPGDDGDRLLAYSDEGYAIINPEGSVEGRGTVLRDVEPTVALCSMESYDPPTPPAEPDLPEPADVESGSGELGNTMLQVVAIAQMLAGIGLLAGWLVFDLQPNTAAGDVVAPVAGLGFFVVGAFLLITVANARLSDRFRAEEYRDRLRAVEEAGERPEFVPSLSETEEQGHDQAAEGVDDTDQTSQ